MPERFFLIDGHAHCYQMFFAIRGLTAPDGEPVNAVYGFARLLRKLHKQYQPDYLAVAFDPPGKVFRHEAYEQYKATRKPMPDELQRQMPLIEEMLSVHRIPALTVENYEADDVMGSAAKMLAEMNIQTVLVSTDSDVEQLLDGMTFVLHLHRDREVFLDEEKLKEQEGIRPFQVVELRALAGDQSDNVPGVPGIGPKRAAMLIEQFGTVENIYANLDQVESEDLRGRLAQNKAQAELSRQLVTIKCDVPIKLPLDRCRVGQADPAEVQSFYHSLGFQSLLSEAPSSVATLPDVARQRTLFPPDEAPDLPPGEYESIDTVEKDYHVIRETGELQKLAAELANQECFVVDLETTSLTRRNAEIVGFAFSWAPHRATYVATAGPAGETVCPLQETLHVLRPVLEDASTGKIGHNLKYDISVLKNYGMVLRGLMCDTMVASYLLRPAERGHGLDALSERLLNYKKIKTEELIGSGRSQVPMNKVSVERVGRYACEDADVTLQLSRDLIPQLKSEELWHLFVELELPLVQVLAEMEWQGIKVDQGQLSAISEQFEVELSQLRDDIFGAAGEEFNINSPKQLSVILFEKLKLPVPANKKRETGYSTDSSVLTGLKQHHPVAGHLLKYRELSKLKSTYADALRGMVNSRTGRLHASFNQTVTATGRLSSSEPNLQNIPVRTDLGRRIRAAFVPREEGMSLVSADYSQVELRILAHCSGDETLREAFKADRDIHGFVAAQIYGVPEQDVTAEMRRRAKAVNFGIIYGQGAYGLSRQIEVTFGEAAKFRDNYFERYPKVKEFIGDTIQSARRVGYVRTLAGRERKIYGIRSGGSVGRAAERIAVNTVIQGSAADLIKMAMINIHRELPKVSPSARMLLQIHDELVFEAPDAELDAVCGFVREKMSGAMELDVPLKVDVGTGKNWEEVK